MNNPAHQIREHTHEVASDEKINLNSIGANDGATSGNKLIFKKYFIQLILRIRYSCQVTRLFHDRRVDHLRSSRSDLRPLF
jgi:hypothetical protein